MVKLAIGNFHFVGVVSGTLATIFDSSDTPELAVG